MTVPVPTGISPLSGCALGDTVRAWIGAIGTVLLLASTTRLSLDSIAKRADRLGLAKTNYEGTPIVSGMGAVLAGIAVLAYVLAAVRFPAERSLAASFAVVTVASGLLGFLDDRWGSRSVGGFRGHFGELRRGRLTTGAAKALLLPPAAFIVAVSLLRQSPAQAFTTTALVALFANTLNLLDVRPARAVTAWLAGTAMVVLVSLAIGHRWWPIGVLVAPVLVYLPDDAQRRVMLGDVGANFLGAVLGLAVATSAPTSACIVLIGLLAALQWYSERHSLNAEIESRRWLRWLDVFTPARGNQPS